MSRLSLLCRTAAAGLALVAATAIAQNGYRPKGIGPSYSGPPRNDWKAVGPYDGRYGNGPGPSNRNDRDRYDRDRYDRDRYDHDHDWHDHHDHHDHDGPSRRPVDVKSVGPFGVIDYGPGKIVVQPKSVIVRSDNDRNFKYGVHMVAPSNIRSRGTYIRQSFNDRNVFSPRWYDTHRSAWQPNRWNGKGVYATLSYNNLSGFMRLPPRPIYYDYGSTVVYTGDTVYVNGNPICTINSYYDQAVAIAQRGRYDRPNPGSVWQSLGVFALVREDQTWAATDFFQLAVNQEGLIRGNFFNTRTDANEPVFGSVDIRSQRAVWTIGENQLPLYDAGIANLTQPETVMLAHFNRGRSGQYLLIRVQQPW